MKIIVLVLSADFEPFISLTNAIKETWASYAVPGIDIYFYYGESNKSNSERDIFFNIKEGFHTLGHKTLNMFEYIKDIDFDYVFRTNSSSFINQEKLLEFLNNKPRKNFYCGKLVSDSFVSGCGYFISKDVLELILNNRHMWNHNLIDDVALGNLMKRLGISSDYSATRFDIFSEDGSFNLPNNIDDYYHYRCKYPQKVAWVPDTDRSNDINVMRKLYNMLKNNKTI